MAFKDSFHDQRLPFTHFSGHFADQDIVPKCYGGIAGKEEIVQWAQGKPFLAKKPRQVVALQYNPFNQLAGQYISR